MSAARDAALRAARSDSAKLTDHLTELVVQMSAMDRTDELVAVREDVIDALGVARQVRENVEFVGDEAAAKDAPEDDAKAPASDPPPAAPDKSTVCAFGDGADAALEDAHAAHDALLEHLPEGPRQGEYLLAMHKLAGALKHLGSEISIMRAQHSDRDEERENEAAPGAEPDASRRPAGAPRTTPFPGRVLAQALAGEHYADHVLEEGLEDAAEECMMIAGANCDSIDIKRVTVALARRLDALAMVAKHGDRLLSPERAEAAS